MTHRRDRYTQQKKPLIEKKKEGGTDECTRFPSFLPLSVVVSFALCEVQWQRPLCISSLPVGPET